MLRYFLLFVFLNTSVFVVAQQQTSKFKPDCISFYYGLGNESNFIFDDPDYLYKTQYLKASFQYKLNTKRYQLGFAVQPQVHFLQHQLLNEFFVQPFQENFEENRTIFTKLKSMRLYALAFEINVSRKIFNRLAVLAFLGVGPAIIDTQTERLAKGFTFIENLGIGIRYQVANSLFFEIKPNISHVSNARLQLPNSGYNILNLEIGVSWSL